MADQPHVVVAECPSPEIDRPATHRDRRFCLLVRMRCWGDLLLQQRASWALWTKQVVPRAEPV